MRAIYNPDVRELQKLWDAHGLGPIKTVTSPNRGSVNRIFIINDTHVIRFNLFEHAQAIRYAGEKLIYDLLTGSALPVPQVVALDLSATLVPHGYLILTKMPGTPLIDHWPNLSAAEREAVGFQAGQYLATLHNYSFENFGRIAQLDTESYSSWWELVEEFYLNCVETTVELKLLEPPIMQKLELLMALSKPLLDKITTPQLVHSDYHFENLLYKDGKITAMLDFESAKGGDPAWDFQVYRQWDDDCPGSQRPIYAGYTSLRPHDHEFAQRAYLYRILRLFDDVVWRAEENDFETSKEKARLLALALAEDAI